MLVYVSWHGPRKDPARPPPVTGSELILEPFPSFARVRAHVRALAMARGHGTGYKAESLDPLMKATEIRAVPADKFTKLLDLAGAAGATLLAGGDDAGRALRELAIELRQFTELAEPDDDAGGADGK